jgi:hypothetical protein
METELIAFYQNFNRALQHALACPIWIAGMRRIVEELYQIWKLKWSPIYRTTKDTRVALYHDKMNDLLAKLWAKPFTQK